MPVLVAQVISPSRNLAFSRGVSAKTLKILARTTVALQQLSDVKRKSFKPLVVIL